MAAIRILENVWNSIYVHLFSTYGEHFAFMLARWTSSRQEPVFMVHDAILLPDEQVTISRNGWELSLDGIVDVINTAVRSGSALIEVHNHGGKQPRFSQTDREGLREFPAYVLDSLPGRPYAATVWGDSTIYGEFFLPDGRTGVVHSIVVVGNQLQQVVSGDDDLTPLAVAFDRQCPWFTTQGQQRLGRLRVAVVGAGGTGSQIIQNLAYLGVRDFVLIEDDKSDDTSMNRLVTAAAADVGTPKAILGRRLIKSVAPGAKVIAIENKVQSLEALDTLKGVDILFGCVDNDAPRLILSELALAYSIPYFDLAAGIEAKDGDVSIAGGRVAIALPDGPCLHCMRQLDIDEARFFLSTTEQQAFMREHGYVRGMDVRAPAVVSLNATVAAVAANEFAVFVSGVRPVNVYTDIDLLGGGRSTKSQWITPIRQEVNAECIQCTAAGTGDGVGIERYAITPSRE